MLIAITAVAVFFLMPSDALAWGTGTHFYIAQGVVESFVLNGELSAMLARNYAAFALGNIMPDVFAFRDWFLKPSAPFVHGWETAHRLLRASVREEETAFALGYISHLSSDVICHNFFIPGSVLMHDHMGGITHVMAESSVEGHIGHPWSHGETGRLLAHSSGLNEFFVSNAGITKKEFERHSSLLEKAFRFKVRSGLDSLAFWSSPGLALRAEGHIGLSINLSAKTIGSPFDSPTLDYCPEGERRMKLSMIRRRLLRLKGAKSFRERVKEGKFDYIHRVPENLWGGLV